MWQEETGNVMLPVLLLAVGLALSPLANAESNVLGEPDRRRLFPTTWDATPAYFPYYDILLTRVYIPDGRVPTLTPHYMCRDGYSVTDAETMFNYYPAFKVALLQLTSDPFWTGGVDDGFVKIYTNRNLHNVKINWYNYKWFQYSVVRSYTDHWFRELPVRVHTSSGWTGAVSEVRHKDKGNPLAGMSQLCARRTWITRHFECSGRRVNLYHWSRKSHRVYYGDARGLCRQTLGFDLPTGNEMGSLSMPWNDKNCREEVQENFADPNRYSWIQSDFFHPAYTRPFFCMGCRLDFREAYGVKSIDSNGKVTCKGGFQLETLSGVQPNCTNGFWDVNTIGRCRRILIVEGNTIYEWKSKDKRDKDICDKSKFASFSDLKKKRPHLLDSIDDMISTHAATSRKSFAEDPICTHVCGPLYEHNMEYFDREAGIVVCKKDHFWWCPHGNCTRTGQPKQAIRCHNGRWYNLAECNPALHGLAWQHKRKVNPGLLRDKHIHIIPETASVQCKFGYYESCQNPRDSYCAGGPTNTPLDIDLSPGRTYAWANLPTCVQFSAFPFNGVYYSKSRTSETAARAKWACELHGMHLLSQVHYTSKSTHQSAIPYFHELGGSWIENTSGTIHYIHSNQTLHKEHESTRKHFTCMRYLNHNKHSTIDYSHVPERCAPSFTLQTTKDNLEICV